MKNLVAQVFEAFGGGASRQLESQGIKQLSYLSKEEFRHPEQSALFEYPALYGSLSRLQCKQTSQSRRTLTIMRFFGLHPQNDEILNLSFAKQTKKDNSPFTKDYSQQSTLNSIPQGAREKAAFTLAEVLITLGVIGIVAMITLPTVAKNYYKRTLEVKLERTYAELKEAIRKSELENGNLKYWDFPTSYKSVASEEFATTYILPYFATNYKVCSGKCFKDKSLPLNNNNIGSGFTGQRVFKYDGKTLLISAVKHEDQCTSSFPGVCTPPAFAQMYIDIDGDKGPSKIGIDVHQFVLLNYIKKTGWGGGTTGEYYGLYPGSMGAGYYASFKYDDEEVKKRCRADGSSYNLPGDCTILLQRNNWKFPKDYPIKF